MTIVDNMIRGSKHNMESFVHDKRVEFHEADTRDHQLMGSLMQNLLDNGISARRGIMTTHRESAYDEDHKSALLPVSENLADNSILIPLYVPMEEDAHEHIVTNIRHAFSPC